MAFSTMLFLKLSVFVFVFMCVYRLGFASKEVTYNELEQQQLDVSVIDLESGRYRRQATTSAPTTDPSTTLETTTPFDINNANILHTDETYYRQTMYLQTRVDDYWVELKNVTGHQTLSNSHRTAVTANLPFKFRFYGHIVDNITIATGGFMYMSPFIHKFLTATQYIAPLMANFETKSGGNNSTVLYKTFGFLYMSPFLHQWLTATQYIAPLMANFDTQIGNGSEILYFSTDTKFVVEWRSVHLQDQNETEPFSFQAILHSNGTIMFVYRQLGLKINKISSRYHRVTVGTSDAFYIDTVFNGQRRRTIYEYHRVAVNKTQIQEGSVIILDPLATCNLFDTCEKCLGTDINFPCRWCGITKKCSDMLDWFRQEWMNNGCVQLSGSANCSAIPTVRPTAAAKSGTVTATSTKMTPMVKPIFIPTNPTPYIKEKPKVKSASNNKGATVAVIVIVVVIVVALFGALGGWFYYAYTHPTSASGMWLMEHRPSQMKAKMNNMKFWKKNGTAGDKYAVESTA